MRRLLTLGALLALVMTWGAPAGAIMAKRTAAADPGAAAHAWAQGKGWQVLDLEIGRGDVNGDGTEDAVAFMAVHAGGASGAYLHLLYLRGSGAGYAVAWVKEQIVGQEPRNIRVSRGAVEWDGTFWKRGEPHCCPTGKRHFREAIPVTATPDVSSRTPPLSPPDVPSDVPPGVPPHVPPGVPPMPAPTSRTDPDQQARAAFAKFVRDNAPAQYSAPDVLARLTGVQIALQRSPTAGSLSADTAGPAVTVRSGEPLRNPSMICRLYDGLVAGVAYRWVGCLQSTGAWIYGIFQG